MDSALSTRALVALNAIERLAIDDTPAQQAFEEVVHRIADVVCADAFFGGATDPETGLFFGAGVTYNMSDEVCRPFWEHEFQVPDFNKFADLDPAEPVADLRRATGGRLDRSPRYRTLNAIGGLEDELRATLPAGGRSWGKLQLNRLAGREPFDEDDLEFVRAVAPLAGAVMRRSLLEEPAGGDLSRGPGVIVLDANGDVLSSTAEADAWVEELMRAWSCHGKKNVSIHPELLTLALGTLTEPTARSRRVRLRTLNGTWLIAHASPLADSGQVALVLEPAKASEIAPIVIEAYGLTAREVEVTRLVARGIGTEEIAGRLFLSRHTVRDHLKAIFEKVGVSSRGELTSKLFAEHYQTQMEESLHGSFDRVAERADELAAGRR